MEQLIDNLDELWLSQNVLKSCKTRVDSRHAMAESLGLPYSRSGQKLMHTGPALGIFKDTALGEADKARLQSLKTLEEADVPRIKNQRETVEFIGKGETNFNMELVNEKLTDYHPVVTSQQNSEPVHHSQPSEDELNVERHKFVTYAKPQLETIDSGKPLVTGIKGISMSRRRRRERKKARTPSLIESNEVKGFEDLGFKFSEDELTPRIVNLVPGLKPRNTKARESTDLFSDTSSTRWLYPSDDWWTEKRIEAPLQNWKIRDTHKEATDIKEELKFWAHAVASTLRQEF